MLAALSSLRLLSLVISRLDPPPPIWMDPGAYLHEVEYTLILKLAGACYVLDALPMMGAEVALYFRERMVDLGAGLFGELYRQLGPVWIGALAIAIALYGVFYMGRWLFATGRPTSAERVVVSMILVIYFATCGAVAVQWFEFIRLSLGKIVYDAAYSAALGGGDAPGPGRSGSVGFHCDWAYPLDGDNSRCIGLEMVMSYLDVGGLGYIGLEMPAGLAQHYFPAPPETIPSKPLSERAALIALASEGFTVTLSAIPLALLALLEAIITFLFSLATLAMFTGLGVVLVFSSFDLFRGYVNDWLDRLLKLLEFTAIAYMLMGLVLGFLWLSGQDLALFLGMSLVGLFVYWQVLARGSALVAESFSFATSGALRVPDPVQAVSGAAAGALTTSGDLAGRSAGWGLGGPLGMVVGGEVGRLPGVAAAHALGVQPPSGEGLRSIGLAAIFDHRGHLRSRAGAAGLGRDEVGGADGGGDGGHPGGPHPRDARSRSAAPGPAAPEAARGREAGISGEAGGGGEAPRASGEADLVSRESDGAGGLPSVAGEDGQLGFSPQAPPSAGAPSDLAGLYSSLDAEHGGLFSRVGAVRWGQAVDGSPYHGGLRVMAIDSATHEPVRLLDLRSSRELGLRAAVALAREWRSELGPGVEVAIEAPQSLSVGVSLGLAGEHGSDALAGSALFPMEHLDAAVRLADAWDGCGSATLASVTLTSAGDLGEARAEGAADQISRRSLILGPSS